MSFKPYWHKEYSLGLKPSKGLVDLLEVIPSNFHSKLSIDVGCGKGRNLSFIKEKSDYLIGLEPIKEACDFCETLDFVDEVVQDSVQNYFANKREHFDFIVAWRVLHLGTYEEFYKNMANLAKNLNSGGYLAIAVSHRDCERYNSTRNEDGGIEIEIGTIRRTLKGNDVRHYFTFEELKNVDPLLEIVNHKVYMEMRGGHNDSYKMYHTVLYKKLVPEVRL